MEAASGTADVDFFFSSRMSFFFLLQILYFLQFNSRQCLPSCREQSDTISMLNITLTRTLYVFLPWFQQSVLSVEVEVFFSIVPGLNLSSSLVTMTEILDTELSTKFLFYSTFDCEKLVLYEIISILMHSNGIIRCQFGTNTHRAIKNQLTIYFLFIY